jgi:hypothetical protein
VLITGVVTTQIPAISMNVTARIPMARVSVPWLAGMASVNALADIEATNAQTAILTEGLRFPTNLAPREIAAEALIKRYGTEGVYECLRYLDSDDLEGNAYWHIQSVFEELYLVEDIPIRTMLLEISTAAKYNDQKAHADELLDTHNLSANAQGVLKETTQ